MPPTAGAVPPVPPVPPMPPTGGAVPPIPPYSTMPAQPAGETEAAPVEQAESEADEPNLEAEREAILRMIAEGRITPEEGDMLLEGLGN